MIYSDDTQFDFLINSPAARKVAERAISADAQAARLPWMFRRYYGMRQWIPGWVRRILQRRCSYDVAADWYLPATFYRQFVEAVTADKLDFPLIHPWPHAAESALILTHDVETLAGTKSILRIVDIEEELGFRSSWNFVPHGYDLDQGLLKELSARGFEIGVHGFNHDGHLFRSRKTFDHRSDKINTAIQDFQADGFRAPMVHRNLAWMQSLHIEYDCSCFDVDPFQPMPGGVGMIWPFRAGRFVEIPYTMPQDHTLFVVRGEKDGTTWFRKADWVRRRQGMVVMLTHPDYLKSDRLLGIYRDFLVKAKEEGDHWHCLARDAATWWRQREASNLTQSPSGDWHIVGPAADRGIAADVTIKDGLLRFESRFSKQLAETAVEIIGKTDEAPR